jgi:hypothetical protein
MRLPAEAPLPRSSDLEKTRLKMEWGWMGNVILCGLVFFCGLVYPVYPILSDFWGKLP